jgi:class 3 adenylate cyclase/tetratricopeptide (TPR) repeat protein
MIEGFVPEDHHKAAPGEIPAVARRHGSAVFCDIVAFSVLSSSLVREHGRRHGAELLWRILDEVIGRTVKLARQRGGVTVAFAGDATTLWFDADQHGGAAEAAAQAAAVALELANSTDTPLPRLRVSMASGLFERLTLGDPEYGRLELLAGKSSLLLDRMDQLAAAGRLVICDISARLLSGFRARISPVLGAKAFVLAGLGPLPSVSLPGPPSIAAEAALTWVPLQLRNMVLSLRDGRQPLAALAEIRPISAVFILICEETRVDAADRIASFLRDLQASLHPSGGLVLELSAEAKGIYAPCIFGAPNAHEDDPERAIAAAMAAMEIGKRHGMPLKIGVARGTGFVGLVSADTRMRYAVISMAMVRAARLMTRAETGTVLATADLTDRTLTRFDFEEVPTAVGEASVWRVTGTRASASITESEPGTPTPLVEREDLLARLTSLIAADGPVFAILESPPGHGKSAILANLRLIEEARGRIWLRGRAENSSRDVPFHAWFPILRDILERAPELELGQETRAVLAWLESQADEPPRSLAGLSGAERAVNTAAVVKSVLSSLNSVQPVTIAFDDLQWADTRSLGLLGAVVSSSHPLRVIASKRPGKPSSMEAAMLFGHPGACTETIERLSNAGVTALAASLLGAQTLSYDLVRLFQDNVAGSPMFVKLIADVLKARGLIRLSDGHCTVVADAEHLGKLDFLESEEAAILARFDELGEAEKRLVRTASLVGRAFTVKELAAALPDAADVQASASLLLKSGYLVPYASKSVAGLEFAQPIVQQALAQSVPASRRATVNRRLARFWADRPEPGSLSHRARHLLNAIDIGERDSEVLKEAISALEKAAHQAGEASASLEASDLLQSAVDLSKRLPDSPETLRQRLHLQAGLAFGLATFRGYGDPSVEAAYNTALALANEAENSEDLAFTIYGVFSFYASRGDYAKAMPVARRLHRLSMHFNDLRLASIAHQSRAIIAILRGRVASGARLAACSVEDADRIGHGMFFPHGGAGDFRIFSGTWLALALTVAGREAEAEAAYRRAFALSEKNPFGRAFLRCFCPLPVLTGNAEAALTEADSVVKDADARGLALFSIIGGIYSGWAAARLGLDDARVAKFLDANINIIQAMGLGSFSPWFLLLAADAFLNRGALDAYEKAVAASEAIMRHSGKSLFDSEAIRRRAILVLSRGDSTSAVALLERAKSAARDMGHQAFFAHAVHELETLLASQHSGAANRLRNGADAASQTATRPIDT